MEAKTLTPEQLADIYQMSVATIYKLIKQGTIRARKFGKVFRIPQSEIAWVYGKMDSDLNEMESIDQKLLDKTNSQSLKDSRKELGKAYFNE